MQNVFLKTHNLIVSIILIFFSNFVLASYNSCLSTYKDQQKYKAHNIQTQDLNDLVELAINGDPVFGWKKLSLLGDSYAELAFQVLKKNEPTNDSVWGIPDINLYHKLITKHWITTVGWNNYSLYFDKMAVLHFRQYVEIILTGYWPDSDQILMSYLSAARFYGLPDEVVFDATWDASGLNTIKSWQRLNHLDYDRIVYPANACYNISKNRALKILARDFAPF